MGKPVEVEFIGRDKSLSSTIDNASDKSNKLGGRLKSLGKTMAVGLAGGALVAGGALLGLAKGAADDEQAASRLAVQLHNSAGATKTQTAAVEDWITAQGKALGVSDDELRPALGRLVTATHDVGEAQRLTALAMDVSTGTGKSLEQVSTALMRAQNGQVSGLSRLGVATKDASGHTMTLDQITKNLAATYGGQASTAADTAAGRFGRVKLALSETGESIGYMLLPVLTNLGDWLVNSGVPALEGLVTQVQNGTGVAGALAGVVVTLAHNFNVIGPSLGVVVAGLAAYKVAMAASAAITAVQTAGTVGATGAQWSLNAALRANPIGLVVTLLVALGVALVAAYQKSETFRAVVHTAGQVAKVAFDGVRTAVGFVIEKVGDFIGWLGKIHVPDGIKSAFDTIRSAVSSVSDAVEKLIGWLGKIKVPDLGAISGAIGKIIPGHANGGRMVSGGLTWVNERGPELMSLPGGTRIIPNGVARNMDGTGGGVNVTIAGPVYGDPRAFAQWIVTQLLAERRIAGPLGLG